MDTIIIEVSRNRGSKGYSYYIYDGDDSYGACEDSDAGICTSTMRNALDRAYEAAKEMLRREA